MESILNFVSIIIIVFGILQIILFFKVWGMTNRVTSIEKRLKGEEHTYEYYMLADEKEKAYLLVKNALIEKLIDLQSQYDTVIFAIAAKEIMSDYIKKMEATGYPIPKHLTSAEMFVEYQAAIRKI